MRKKITAILGFIITLFGVSFLSSCASDDDSVWEQYKEWRTFNDNWLIEQTVKTNPNGTAFYTKCVMPTDPQAYVLMHSIGEVNTQNYKPLFSSAVKVNYTLKLANDSVIDSGAGFASMLSSSYLITGWSLAIMQLHVGDSAQFIVPYNIGYGATGATNVPPYSNLQFNIRLLEILNYETKP